MANVTRQDERTVWVEVRIPKPVFDGLALAYGSRGRAMAALREDLPALLSGLLDRAPYLPPAAAASADPPAAARVVVYPPGA